MSTLHGKLSKRAIQEYLKDPHHCPWCGNEDISTHGWNGDKKLQEVLCHNCGAEWTDYYKIATIQPVRLELSE